MNDTLEQLARYVGQQLRLGIPEQNIRASLAQNRWTPEWIDAVFNVVHQNPNLYQAPSRRPPETGQPVTRQQQGLQSNFNVAQAAASQSVQQASLGNQPEERLNTRGKSKKIWLILAVIVVLLGLSAGAYLLLQPQKQAENGKNKSTISQEDQKQAKTPDEDRKDDLNTLLSDLADFYVTNGFYPTYDALKSPEFAGQNPTFDTKAFADPKWSADNAACSADGKAIMAQNPTPNCYAYSTTTPDGKPCDNAALKCIHMTVTATLDSGQPYAIVLERNIELEL